MASKSGGGGLPFEPRQKKKKISKQPPPPSSTQAEIGKTRAKKSKTVNSDTIPDAVSKRMIRRMAIFSGIPTGLAMSSFFVFYWVVSHEWLEIPTAAVGAVTLGLFGLGVLGLTYGILSASWDEQRVGSWFGFEELKINFGRMKNAWSEARKEAKGN